MNNFQYFSLNGLRAMIPSRFWATLGTVIGTTAGAVIYDKRKVQRIIKERQVEAEKIGNQPAEWNTWNRKVVVYLDPHSGWARFWFTEYVKPIFDAGAVDYQIVEPKDHLSDIILKARDLIWNAKEMTKEGNGVRARQKAQSWLSTRTEEHATQDQNELQNRLSKVFLPHLYKPLYDDRNDLVAIGPQAWKHLLLGLEEGAFTSKEMENETRQQRNVQYMPDDSITLPSLGYINTKINSGFLKFPVRVFGWFTRRNMAEIVTADALKIVIGHKRMIRQEDVFLGVNTLIPNERMNTKDLTPKDIVQEAWTIEAETKNTLDPLLADRLKMIG